ncbi:DUF2254 domain-containing protein [Roseospira marina]|uniref:DUF2254 domain-containing protein n=1 Tax=Roseospira marina TaxID=140057 RepID=A0A5M6IFI3_9PROT|nr:DUF2254 domain-containing protein [Roseospira marina]KAA5606983.1 DUF2254 domain-containing protein [Roseospira marina]MBB4312837.1 putative membrane protein [Roseospira marina]MBB5086390.1 putative membrane protein [Roseospira marina]
MAVRLLKSSLLYSLRRLFRGFLVLPGLLAFGGVLLALGGVWLDRLAPTADIFQALDFMRIQAEGARTVLATIAGAMMTVISLVYSITLVVFTLAAGNIAPRLLETFADNRSNQVTLGLLGATFLYSLFVLYIVGQDEVPRLTVALAIVLAAVSFFAVLYFVNDVARRVMVDNEIGRTQRSLRAAIDSLLAAEPRADPEEQDTKPSGDGRPVLSAQSGYVIAVNGERLLDLATRHEGFIEVIACPGRFVIEGEPLARVYGAAFDDADATIREAVVLHDARSPSGDIRFTVHLNIEIALRALSPGINDAYTAISAIDHTSASLARLLQRGAPSSLMRDSDETARVWLDVISMKDILGAALHPLRRASAGNMLVTLRLVEAINRMARVCRARHAPLLQRHLRLIADDARREVKNRDDRQELAEAIRTARTTLARHWGND